jgi:SAM-dependent methyltransferase
VCCESCGFTHLVPIPTQKELDEFYADFYTVHKPDYVKRYEEDLDWWKELYGWFEERIWWYLESRVEAKVPCKVMDVGSGPGFFVEFMREKGWESVGVDVNNPRNVAGILQIDFLHDDLLSMVQKQDAIVMYEYLEHCPDPIIAMDRARYLLKTGGVLLVVTPNDFNPLQLLLAPIHGFWWVSVPDHINYFNHESICDLMVRWGFKILDATATFPLEAFQLLPGPYSSHYLGVDDRNGRKMHARRKEFERIYGQRRHALYHSLSNLGLGRESVIFAQKIS